MLAFNDGSGSDEHPALADSKRTLAEIASRASPYEVPANYILTTTRWLCTGCGSKAETSQLCEVSLAGRTHEARNFSYPKSLDFLWEIPLSLVNKDEITAACVKCFAIRPRHEPPTFRQGAVLGSRSDKTAPSGIEIDLKELGL